MRWTDRITFDPAVMGGRPCIRGLRVTVGMLVGLVSAGRSEVESLQINTCRQSAKPFKTEMGEGANAAFRRKHYADSPTRL